MLVGEVVDESSTVPGSTVVDLLWVSDLEEESTEVILIAVVTLLPGAIRVSFYFKATASTAKTL